MSEVGSATLLADEVSKAHLRRLAHELHFTTQQAVRNTFAVVVVAVFVGAVVVPYVGWLSFVAWAALTITAFGIRLVLLRSGNDLAVIEQNPTRWAALLFTTTIVSGIIGASAPLLYFMSLPALERMFLTMIFACWVTGAMAAVGAYSILYASYVFVFIGQLILAWLRTDDPHVASIVAMLVVYGLVIGAFGRRFAKQVSDGVDIRFQNEALVHELDAARRTAEAASLAKSRFLAVASHDLRQPLHTLTILSGLLKRYASSDKIGEVAQQITQSVGSLEKLFSSILDLSRLEVGAVQPDLRATSFASLVSQLDLEYRARAHAKGLGFETQSCDVTIVTDPLLLERILRNLLDNAIKYTERGRVDLSCERRADAVVVYVRDSGPGIRPEDREAVFEEFFQAGDRRYTRDTGLGLGLAIVQRLTGLLDYAIEVDSQVGAGTAFKLIIPGHTISANPAESGVQLPADVKRSLEGLSIVYIDDDTHAHAAMQLLLKEWGCDVTLAATLEEARTRLQARGLQPEAILSDYRLGKGATGLEAIEALRAEYGALPAAIITGEIAPGARAQLKNSEYPVLLKPVQPEELYKLLEVFRSVG